jgi:hypothetical protein
MSDDSYYARDEDCLWEKPAWAKKGGLKLRSTGYADAMKKEGNLAAPITFTPFKSEDHKNYVANPEILATTDLGDKMKNDGNLAMPITNIRDEMRKQKMGSRYPRVSNNDT